MAPWFFALLALPTGAMAQEVYGPADPNAVTDEDPADIPLMQAELCEETVREDGTIVVCRERPETERYRSPLPRPVQSDRRHVPGLTDPPCWVSNPEAVGTLACMRMGYAPEPVLMVDLTQFPEDLTAEEAAAIVEVAPEEPEEGAPTERRRIPIDITEDE
ncbi:hypothetical protein BMF35_a0794 [Aurantiacibacter gangjinensis]|nr:hypothetical protein BMF35_a0794 [Aurantiacibacter gangjinensis]